jgi:hypothetical protein
MIGANVTGIDFTFELLTQANLEASTAEADGMYWYEEKIIPNKYKESSSYKIVSLFM